VGSDLAARRAGGNRWAGLFWGGPAARSGVRALPRLWGGVAVTLLLLLSGCASGWRNASQAAKSKPAKGTSAATKPAALDEAAMEKRVKAYAHFAAGIVRDMNGDPERAQEEFWQSALADPGHEPLVIDLAQRLFQREQPEKAAELLARAAAQPGASGLIHGWLGFAQAKLGKTELAIAADRMAIKKAPQLLIGYQNLAQLYLQQKRPPDALKVLDEAARQEGVSAGFLADLAELLAGTMRAKGLAAEEVKPRVVAALERAAKLKPDQPLVIYKMAEAYRAVGELAKATELYQDLLKNHPLPNPAFTPVLREQLMQLYLRRGDRGGAAEQLRAILRENPTNPQAYYLLGNLAFDQKDYSEAASNFAKALMLNPDLEPVYYDLARLQLALDKPEEALETLKRARARFPAGYFLEFFTGLAQAARKQYAEAVKSYAAAEAWAKVNDATLLTHFFYFQFGAAYERSGGFAEAERQFRVCLEKKPDFAEALNYLGYMWAERGLNLEEARTMIQKAVEQEPKNAAYLDSLGWVLFKLKRTDEALKYLLQAVENAEKPDPTLLDHLGDIYAALGRAEEARSAWRKALDAEGAEETLKGEIKKKLDGAAGAPKPP
jgi:tetratricopeptide (TPR) repeat protein